jgi:hypothetical protein
MQRRTAGIVGFVVASMIPAIVFSAFTPLVERSDIVGRIGLFPGFYLFSASATVLVALPTFFLFLRFNLVRWWSVLGVGFAIGALMAIIVRWPTQPREVIIMGGIGVLSALGFWVVWTRGSEPTQASIPR